jgi:hypothetical protein
MESKKYTFVATLEFEAESEEDAYEQLSAYISNDTDNEFHNTDFWALDPLCEDDF